jgi:two-component system sensor kinase FixL
MTLLTQAYDCHHPAGVGGQMIYSHMAFEHPFKQDQTFSLLQSVVETAIDGIFLIDTHGTILMINPAAHSLFGYQLHELEGRNVTVLMPSPHRENHDRYVHNYLDTGIKKIIGIGREIEGLRKDGSLFPARLAVSEIIRDGHHYFTGIIHDLSDIKSIENKLLTLNQELEAIVEERTTELQDAVNRLLDTNLLLNQSIEKHKAYESALVIARDELSRSLDKEKELGDLKSRFISMASHEFKTPLSTILSSAALISRYETTEQAADRKRHIERIKASVTHLNTILSDFLSLTKLEEGKFRPQITAFSIEAIITDLLSELEVILKKDQRIMLDYKTDVLQLQSDRNIIRNILYNLFSNAIKYSNEGSLIKCIVEKRNDNMVVHIDDEGIGIPSDDMKHIGSRFFRSSNVTNIPGTGLGLNIVLAYLQELHGDLSFESHKDRKGTTFTLTVPYYYETENTDH